jgi:5-methylcytosine-specific restriction endonuclease McrA
MRTCITCGETKPLGEFYRRSDSPDGYRNDCKVCRKRRSMQNYKDDVENKRARLRAHYRRVVSENPDFHREKYWLNPEFSREQGRKYYRQNRERRIEKAVAYAKNNRAKANATGKKYKVAKQNACPPWVLASSELCGMMEDVYQQAQELTKETGVMHHVDHIIPIQGPNVCGLHVPWNLQVLTASENCSKQNKVLEDAA